MNLCCACGEDFASVAAFDAHRVGSQAKRRCLSPAQIEASFERNKWGRWSFIDASVNPRMRILSPS